MKTRPLLSIIALLSLSAFAFAQEPPPVPVAPYIAPVPAQAHWVVSLKYAAVAQPETTSSTLRARPAAIETERSKDRSKVSLRYGSGTEVFHLADGCLFSRIGAEVKMRTLITDPPPFTFYTEGYLFVPTIKAEMYKGLETIEGRPCFHYAGEGVDVWVDKDSLLPVAAKTAEALAVFKFLTPPSGPIPLPPEEAALLKNQQRALAAFRAMR